MNKKDQNINEIYEECPELGIQEIGECATIGVEKYNEMLEDFSLYLYNRILRKRNLFIKLGLTPKYLFINRLVWKEFLPQSRFMEYTNSVPHTFLGMKVVLFNLQGEEFVIGA